MELHSYVKRLQEKHTQLKSTLSLEYLKHLPDTAFISSLKHQKLALKDRIQRLSHSASS